MQARNATGADWPSIQITAAPPSDTLARPTVRVRFGSAPRYGRYSISAGAGCSLFQASTSSAGGTGRTLPIC